MMMQINRERNRRLGREQGFTYTILLILVAIMGVALAATGMVWSTEVKREKEQELLFVGSQFRNAITLYYKNSPGQSVRYPMSLEDLLQDPRYPDTRRYLRKIYYDPISGTTDWGLVRGPNGEVLGVHSLSEEMPLKNSNFALADRDFEGREHYSEWRFTITAQAWATQQISPR